MNFSFYIAKRYLRTTSKNNAINIISAIASLGVIVSAMALFVFLSVFSGLKDFSLSFTNKFDPDLKVMPKTGKSFFMTEAQKTKLKQIEGITYYSRIVEEKVLFVYRGKEQVAQIKGVDNQYNLVNNVQESMFQGNWIAPQTPQVVVGFGIGQKLSMGLYDLNNTFEIFVPRPGKGAITNPETAFNKSNLIPVGVYAINDELDSKYVFADVELTQELLEYQPNQISAIEVKTDSTVSEEAIVDQIKTVFGDKVIVKNRMQLNDSLHKMLNTENTVIYLIFTLVIIMTLFTLAGAIIMIILDKKDNLKTLYNLGNTIRDIRRIFLLQGTLVTVLGGALGIALGVIVVFIQEYFKLVMITESLAYPVRFNLENCAVVFFTIVVLGFMASYIASSNVNKKLFD